MEQNGPVIAAVGVIGDRHSRQYISDFERYD
jgi:hypothetical protein